MRISLTEKNGEIKGTIGFEADDLLNLEMLALIVQNFADRTNQPIEQAIQDIYAVAAGRVK